MYSALSAEVSPVKQFNDQEHSSQETAQKSIVYKSDQQPDRYKDILQISSYIPKDNSKNCTCGSCPACLGKFKDDDNLSKFKKNNPGSVDEAVESPKSDKSLSVEEKEEIQQLKKRDQEVRTHEQAHVSAGAKNAQYEYETGPDGKRYATGGHAEIETSKGDSPESTISKAQQIKKAALAPSNPSSQDRKVAAEAEAMIAQAQKELRTKAQKKSIEPESEKINSQMEQNVFLKDQQENQSQVSTGNENGSKDEIINKIQDAVKPDDQFSALAPFSSSQLKDITQNYSRLNKLQMKSDPFKGASLNVRA